MKRLIIINHYAGLPHESSGTRHWHLAKELIALGWEVEIIAADTLHPSGEKRQGLTESSGIENDMHGNPSITLIRAPIYRNSESRRLLNMIMFFFNCLLYLMRKKERPSVVIGSSVHPLAPLAALIFCTLRKVTFIFEIRDLWPETLIAFRAIEKKSIIARLLFLLERLLWSASKGIVSPLLGVPNYGAHQKYVSKPFLHLPNGVKVSDIPFKSLTRNTPRRLAYMGSIGFANDLELLIDSIQAHKLKFPDSTLHLDFFGDGPLKRKLARKALDFNLTNVSFLGSVQREKLLERLGEYHGFVLPFYDAPKLYSFGASPNKLADYLGAARPVLIGQDFPGNPVAQGINGFIVNHSVESWVQNLQHFVELDHLNLMKMSIAARRTAVEKLNFEDLAQNLNDFLIRIAKFSKA